MRVVVQRVKKASVVVDKKTVGAIDEGMLLLVGFSTDDEKSNVDKMLDKVLNLRIFDDENGIMNLAIDKEKAKILSVSQFTLYADTTKGNRPSYIKAQKGEKAEELYNYFNERLKEKIKVETGVFGAEMEVSMIGDGPVTILLEK